MNFIPNAFKLSLKVFKELSHPHERFGSLGTVSLCEIGLLFGMWSLGGEGIGVIKRAAFRCSLLEMWNLWKLFEY